MNLSSIIQNVLLKIRYMHEKVKISGFSCIEKGVDIKVFKGASLTIGRYCNFRKNTYLSVTSDAVLCLGDNVFVNRNVNIVAHDKIKIGTGVTIGPNVCIFDHDHDKCHRGSFVTSPIEIGDNVWIGAGAIILKGVSIGENAIIAAGSMVISDIPSNSVLIQNRQNTIIKKENNEHGK